MAKDLPIDSRIIEQLSKATVKNIMDGVVELVTNSDDSYKRLEEKGTKTSGLIKIYIYRKKGGIYGNLKVKDSAEGMTSDELEKAITLGAPTSGFEKGKSVRGLFGRGLKETIISLGDGEIKTIKNGKESKTRIWIDHKFKKPLYDEELLEKTIDTSEPNGTEININISNEKIKIPSYDNFKYQLSRHYALRDINSSKIRIVKLEFVKE